jgi:hypothetical protein
VRVLACVLAAVAAVPAAGGARPAVPSFRHVLVVVFENRERGQVLGRATAPTFNALAREYAVLSRYTGVAHPSLPNYLALVSGSTHGIETDCTACVVRGRSLADELDAAGRSWKTYAEGLPRPGFEGVRTGGYVKRHDPLLYFHDVADAPSRAARVVPFTQLARDLAAHALPDFALVVPNLCDDMHDCSVATGDRWLRRNVVPLLALRELAGSVVFVIFDEGVTDAGGGGRVAALALGPAVRPHSRFRTRTNHYALLRTIEDAWRLPHLGRSASAAPITGIWK